MLVGSGVKNHVRVEVVEDLPHPRRVQNVAHERHDSVTMSQADQFLFDLECLRFGPFNQQ